MALIIAATDFSELGNHSVNYACQLGNAQGARVLVVHTFILPTMFSDVPMPASMLSDEQHDAENQMADLVNELTARFEGLIVKGRVLYGDTVEILDEIRDESGDLWMVVLGNASLAQLDVWPESVLLEAIKRLKFPVLAVPHEVQFRKVQRICLAVDNNPAGYADALARMRRIEMLQQVEWHLLNVQSGTNASSASFPSAELLHLIEDLKPTCHTVNSVMSVDETILSFVVENNFDWLVMMPRKHSFFEALLHKSHTRALARQVRIPILAIHEAKE